MCEAEKMSREWLDGVVPKITSNLGKAWEETEAEYELSIPMDSLYLSSTCYVNIRAKGSGKRMSLVVKRPPQLEAMRETIRSDSQFHNEILFYRSYAKGTEDFPRCVYHEWKPPRETVIVLENAAERGYSHCPWKYQSPFDYTVAAIREIARFHGRGYVMKEQHTDKFFELIRNIRETRYDRDQSNEKFRAYTDLLATRAIDYLREQNYEKKFCDKIEAFLGNAFENVMMRVVEPDEPLSTLCHGDFTLNNTLFKKKNGSVTGAMLIDFALIRYGSPVIDLSTYFCLCHADGLAKERFTQLLKTYHNSLMEYLLNNGVKSVERFSYERLYEDFKRGGLFGFVIASFYLSTLMGKASLPLEEVFTADIELVAKAQRQDGGEQVSKILADMLLNLRDIGCLDHVL